jgi:3-isopropylmalate/(R)-2-methylmalate dehydratase small subunit
VAELREAAERAGGQPTVVDLVACRVISPAGRAYPFAVDAERRTMLLEGLDEIGLTLKSEAKIAAFQARHKAARPWVYATRWRLSDGR